MTITLDSLRRAITAHLGQTLTPEVAASLEVASYDRQDRSIDPAQFGQQQTANLIFKAESLRLIRGEIHPLHEAHFAETEKHRLGFGLDVDYDYLVEMERMGRLIQFTARDVDTNHLVGNIRLYVQKSVHTGTLYASEDTFYLLPTYRKGWTGLRFWRFAERAAQQIGVREMRTDSKVLNDVHKLNIFCGYTHVANKYVKVFDNKELSNV